MSQRAQCLILCPHAIPPHRWSSLSSLDRRSSYSWLLWFMFPWTQVFLSHSIPGSKLLGQMAASDCQRETRLFCFLEIEFMHTVGKCSSREIEPYFVKLSFRDKVAQAGFKHTILLPQPLELIFYFVSVILSHGLMYHRRLQ